MCGSSAQTLITYYLDPIFTWTAFDASEGIPYLNFNDCELHILHPPCIVWPKLCRASLVPTLQPLLPVCMRLNVD